MNITLYIAYLQPAQVFKFQSYLKLQIQLSYLLSLNTENETVTCIVNSKTALNIQCNVIALNAIGARQAYTKDTRSLGLRQAPRTHQTSAPHAVACPYRPRCLHVQLLM